MDSYADLFDGISLLSGEVHLKVDSLIHFIYGIGLLPGEIHLEVDSSVHPVQMPLRGLPIPIKHKVHDELKKMENDDIITSVNEPATWISVLLMVMKANGRIRLCIDSKP